MDVQRYISSGIIESYVAGLATDPEVRDLHSAMAQSPELKAAVDAVQLDMERYVEMQSVPPPATAKDKLFLLINNDQSAEMVDVMAAGPVPAYAYEAEVPRERKPLQLVHPAWRVVAAAAIAGLIGCGYYIFQQSGQQNEWKAKYEAIVLEKENMLAENKTFQTRMEESQTMLTTIRNMKAVNMYTVTPTRPGLLATVYWNQKTQEVLLTVHNLPEPAADQQYQLWSIVNGKPVDAGVFEMGSAATGFQKMKAVPGAQMFAVTLEKKGGSPTPTLTAMYLAGKVAG
ncbi:anti-sigma factor [Chitinophaga sp. NPDC101104]|uniref:anti-sigma factor n=1 Tax=Chitinophaga sp. NPDC101104 TaxID=3390561 RepID=UPI003D0281C7